MKNSRTRLFAQQVPLDAILLEADSSLTLHRQLYQQLKQLILDSTLKAGTAMPSSRLLARDLGVGRNTIIAAYEQLASEGYLETAERSRTAVADLALGRRAQQAAPAGQFADKLSERGKLMGSQPRQASFPGELAFHPGTPDIASFPFDQWRRLLSRRLISGGDDLFGYHSITGHPALKESIAAYLRASRNVDCEPSQIVVTTGAQAALDLLSRMLLQPGDPVWMEEPGYLGAQSTFLAAGAVLKPLHVNENGWQLDDLPSKPMRAIYLTPSCHFPLGVTMRMEQRLRLLEIARQWDSWIIEDDFDSEYRFTGQPIPAMQGADPTGRTIYVGTFAKTLFPALRLGFMVLPPGLLDPVRRAINITGQFAPLVLQATLADFMDRGMFAQHLRRMRRLYARRRDMLVSIGQQQIGHWLSNVSSDAGIQTLWNLDSRWRDLDLADAAAAVSLNIAPLSRHYRHGEGRNGLILGYAALDEQTMRRGFDKLRQLLGRR